MFTSFLHHWATVHWTWAKTFSQMLTFLISQEIQLRHSDCIIRHLSWIGMDIFSPRALLISKDGAPASGEVTWSRPMERSGAKRFGGLWESEGEDWLADLLVLVSQAFLVLRFCDMVTWLWVYYYFFFISHTFICPELWQSKWLYFSKIFNFHDYYGLHYLSMIQHDSIFEIQAFPILYL